MLRINGVPVTNKTHTQVVESLRSSPVNSAVELLVCATDSATPDAVLSHDQASLRSDATSMRSRGVSGSGDIRTVLVVVRDPATNSWLSIRLDRQGWWLPAGSALSSETVPQAAHRLVTTKTGVAVRLVGVLRIEQDVLRGRLRVVILAHPLGSTTLSDTCRWMTLPELQGMHRLGRPPWPEGTMGLGGTELLDWGRYIVAGGFVAPVYFIADRGDPIHIADDANSLQVPGKIVAVRPASEADETGVNSPLIQISVPSIPAPAQDPTPSTAPAQARAAPAPAPISSIPARPLVHHSSLQLEDPSGELPARPVGAASAAVDRMDSTAEDDRGESPSSEASSPTRHAPPALKKPSSPRKLSRSVSFSDIEPEKGDTHHRDDYERALEAGDGLAHLGELFQKNAAEMQREQEAETKASVANTRMRAFYIERKSYDSFGITVMNIPRTDPASPEFNFAESVVITAIDPDGAAAADGNLQVNDRVVILNSQWILSLAQTTYLLSALSTASAIDITIARGEPLPELPDDFLDSTDGELELMAFEHAGLRARVGDSGRSSMMWSRGQVMQILLPRFAAPPEVQTRVRDSILELEGSDDENSSAEEDDEA